MVSLGELVPLEILGKQLQKMLPADFSVVSCLTLNSLIKWFISDSAKTKDGFSLNKDTRASFNKNGKVKA